MLIASLVAIPIAAVVLLSMGITAGEEFSPDDFTRRRFFYNRIPIFNWTVFKKTYTDTTPNFEQDLLSNNLITAANNVPQVWHLSEDSGVEYDGLQPTECDARFLVDYLDLQGTESNSYWEQWNEKHPQLAKIFWPVVADLARHEMYLAIPDIMRMAMAVDAEAEQQAGMKTNQKAQGESFQTRLNKMAVDSYTELGELDQQAGRTERAKIRFQRAAEIRAQ